MRSCGRVRRVLDTRSLPHLHSDRQEKETEAPTSRSGYTPAHHRLHTPQLYTLGAPAGHNYIGRNYTGTLGTPAAKGSDGQEMLDRTPENE